MRLPRNNANAKQLDLLADEKPEPATVAGVRAWKIVGQTQDVAASSEPVRDADVPEGGRPLMVPIDRVCEDADNPRTEFPDDELAELAEDLRQRGILQPIVVHSPDQSGCYRIHFGAKRLRAAKRAGLHEVLVVVRRQAADPYAQIAENQKRHGLTPLDLARFIRRRVDAGEPNVEIAKRLGMDLTTVGHHLALLTLPPVLDDALKSGRCRSPRTLHELSKLHDEHPELVEATIASPAELTRSAVVRLKVTSEAAAPGPAEASSKVKRWRSAALLDQVERLCNRLEAMLQATAGDDPRVYPVRLADLRRRLVEIAGR